MACANGQFYKVHFNEDVDEKVLYEVLNSRLV